MAAVLRRGAPVQRRGLRPEAHPRAARRGARGRTRRPPRARRLRQEGPRGAPPARLVVRGGEEAGLELGIAGVGAQVDVVLRRARERRHRRAESLEVREGRRGGAEVERAPFRREQAELADGGEGLGGGLVEREDDGLLGRQRAQRAHHLERAARVEPRRGLVEHEHRRRVQELHRERRALALSSGNTAQLAGGPGLADERRCHRRQAERRQQRLEPRVVGGRFGGRDRAPSSVERRAKLEVLEDSEAGEEMVGLRHEAGLRRRVGVVRPPVQLHRAALRLCVPGEHRQQSRLAAAGSAHQRDEAAVGAVAGRRVAARGAQHLPGSLLLATSRRDAADVAPRECWHRSCSSGSDSSTPPAPAPRPAPSPSRALCVREGRAAPRKSARGMGQGSRALSARPKRLVPLGAGDGRARAGSRKRGARGVEGSPRRTHLGIWAPASATIVVDGELPERPARRPAPAARRCPSSPSSSEPGAGRLAGGERPQERSTRRSIAWAAFSRSSY